MLKKIGILGVGMVGGAMRCYFEEKREIKPFLYDKGKNLGSPEEVNKAEIVFVCVPTPYDKKKGFDLSFVKEAVDILRGQKVIVMKSTVMPGTAEYLQKKYPQHKFLMNPEFLSEATADFDMQNPDRQIVGYTKKSKNVAKEVLALLPRAPFETVIPSTEAELVKYFNNTFNSIKVIFANQMYDLCQAMSLDYNRIMECAAKSQFIRTKDHLAVWHKGYRGFGGKCLFKDHKALIQLANKQGLRFKLHKVADEINEELMRQQGIEDPEKFSKRE